MLGVTERGDLLADLVCVGMGELVEDGQGVVPRVAGGGRVADGEVGVTEAVECVAWP
jgi:hypothetical protein